jgi:cytoskeleton protein RodZ
VPERLAPLAEQAIPPAAPTVAEAAASDAPQVAAVTAAPPLTPVAAAEEAPAPVAAEAPSVGAAQAATVAPGANESRIVLRANADAWIMLKDRSGAVLLNRVLKSGETWSVPPRPDLLLTTGNAGGTEVLLDGVLAPPLGSSGGVRRDLPLDPQAIKDGRLTAAATPPVASARAHQ